MKHVISSTAAIAGFARLCEIGINPVTSLALGVLFGGLMYHATESIPVNKKTAEHKLRSGQIKNSAILYHKERKVSR